LQRRWCHGGVLLRVQELTKSMAMFGYDILQALVNDIAPDAKVGDGRSRQLTASRTAGAHVLLAPT
jgi:hypothetical protein